MKDLKNHQVETLKEALDLNEKSFFIRNATGSGKTKILKSFCDIYYENNKNDNRKILILAPRVNVFKAFKKEEFDADYVTYPHLWNLYKKDKSNLDNYLTDYSIIICDEAHQTGAKLWGIPINYIKEKGNYEYFIGTSANSRRGDQKDQIEDQADILFDGNIIGKYDLDVCFKKGIFQTPRYLGCEYTLSQQINDEINKLKLKNIPDYVKAELEKELTDLAIGFENKGSVEQIFKDGLIDYKNNKNLKIIVFNGNKKEIEENKKLFEPIFNSILGDHTVYDYISGSKNNEKNLNCFLKDSGINILYSINKANESIHHDDLKVIIMARKTESEIVYEQQLGRILSVNSKDCLVIDLANNFNNVKGIFYSNNKPIINDQNNRVRSKNDEIRDKNYFDFQTKVVNFVEAYKNIKNRINNLEVFEYKGEVNNLRYFSEKYEKVLSDIKHFINLNYSTEIAIEYARTEYFDTINGVKISAKGISKILNENENLIRYKLKKGEKFGKFIEDNFTINKNNIDIENEE